MESEVQHHFARPLPLRFITFLVPSFGKKWEHFLLGSLESKIFVK